MVEIRRIRRIIISIQYFKHFSRHTVLQLFTVYQWDRGLCSASTGEYGVCMLENECIMKRGILGGPCAEGHGTCCICKNSIFCIILKTKIIQHLLEHMLSIQLRLTITINSYSYGIMR